MKYVGGRIFIPDEAMERYRSGRGKKRRLRVACLIAISGGRRAGVHPDDWKCIERYARSSQGLRALAAEMGISHERLRQRITRGLTDAQIEIGY